MKRAFLKRIDVYAQAFSVYCPPKASGSSELRAAWQVTLITPVPGIGCTRTAAFTGMVSKVQAAQRGTVLGWLARHVAH